MKNILLVQDTIKKEIAAIDKVYNSMSYPDQLDVKHIYDEMIQPLKDKLFFTKQLVDLTLYAREKGIDIDS
jgi:methyl coenzyme M reductase subunit C-like uncharacterized protein (methanogenesis marker protein 7)